MSKRKVSKSYETAEKINQELLTSGITIPRMAILIQDTLDKENIRTKAEHGKMLDVLKAVKDDCAYSFNGGFGEKYFNVKTTMDIIQSLITEIEKE